MILEAGSDFWDTLFNSEKLIHYGGLTLLMVIIFAETGLFVGFFLPGDALLFTSGLLCGTKDLDVNIFLLLLLVTVAAAGGNTTGYFTGKFFGPRLFRKNDSWFFRKSHLEKARQFYRKYGGGSVVAGRFLPVVRTFVPIVSGAIDMPLGKFMVYNLAGAFLWVWSFILIGYVLGKKVPGVLDHIEYIILGIFLITTFIIVRGYLKLKKSKKKTTRRN
jgi:membrane-associated protein